MWRSESGCYHHVIAISIHACYFGRSRNSTNLILMKIWPEWPHLTGQFVKKVNPNRLQIGCPFAIRCIATPARIPASSTLVGFYIEILKMKIRFDIRLSFYFYLPWLYMVSCRQSPTCQQLFGLNRHPSLDEYGTGLKLFHVHHSLHRKLMQVFKWI